MLTTNKLTKTFASGIATISIAAVAGIVNAPSAGAQVGPPPLCFDGTVEALLGLGSVECGDKLFSNFDIDDSLGEGSVVIEVNSSGDWEFRYGNDNLGFVGSHSLAYDIHITDPNFFFEFVGLDSDVDPLPPPEEVTKDIFIDNGDGTFTALDTLISLNGNSDFTDDLLSLNLQNLRIVDTITLVEGSNFDQFENVFRQAPHDVPEPGTILGLLAVGGLGLVSRFKKQK
jgi:hypothetical protein